MSNLAKAIYDSWSKPVSNTTFLCDNDYSINFSQFLNLVGLRSKALNISRGQKALVSSRRGLCFFVDLFAVWAAGGIVIPFDPQEGENHRCALLKIADVDLVIEDLYELTSANKSDIRYTDISINDTCAILFTSGSTGAPKGVELSLYSLLENAKGILSRLNILNTRLLINIPFHFTSAICHFLACALSNSTLIGLESRLLYLDFIKEVISHGPDGIGGAPIQCRWLADYCESENGSSFDKLDFIISSGDHLPVTVINSLCSNLPSLKIYTVYGLTEVGGRFCVLQPEELDLHIGSVGKPIDKLSLTIVDPDEDTIKPIGCEGEIVISGELLAKGYYRNIEATSNSFTEHGFRTGDIGYIDDAGFLYLKGRSGDIFKVNGKKVSGTRITQGLMDTGYFMDSAVISAEFPIFGTVPVAFVVLIPGLDFEKGKILKDLRKLLPSNHIPHAFHVLSSIPRTGSGKAKLNELRLMLAQYNNH